LHPFRAAIEARDVDSAIALLADDVVFRSSVVFALYHGRDAVAPILSAAVRHARTAERTMFDHRAQPESPSIGTSRWAKRDRARAVR
jgi:ketosteroid isomerase-like protein